MKTWLVLLLPLIGGCYGREGEITDPTERGLVYIGSCIISAAIIRAFFNK